MCRPWGLIFDRGPYPTHIHNICRVTPDLRHVPFFGTPYCMLTLVLADSDIKSVSSLELGGLLLLLPPLIKSLSLIITFPVAIRVVPDGK